MIALLHLYKEHYHQGLIDMRKKDIQNYYLFRNEVIYIYMLVFGLM